ncbi:hypothetical protein Q2295_02330 [Leptospira interrogans]|uniref:7-cyano-7-deazaguanine synthase n=2 Tax=Leptospira interrogans TaxID=173 RepID=A0AA40W8Z9_LEPIR|nr:MULTISPECIES: hypothetical protein [Leptospira]EJO77757.1 hypothetical protein LEP1GSC045_1223 [Leptospira interrogans serovar Pomona str. Kennewicki LC82-25]EKN98260.1 hypothetical protein LEP1GSC014_2133 [Leptospira interrogans serovar Pomona str. Pomona]EMI62321.1 hypothetical protein LEP1GSC200_2835 [Leptospira interrogans serovar Pomona str. CSL10083]EMJ59448.1 hypothetical protein LEP1GSC197_1745 [Leptospira interrogans serovar Pomona str. CSL4002]KYZ61700.1 hypothetical protein AWU66
MNQLDIKVTVNSANLLQFQYKGNTLSFRRKDGIEKFRRSAFSCDLSLDLCNIIGLISTIERLIPRQEIYKIDISLPILSLKRWQDSEIINELKFMISQFTINDYSFDFYPFVKFSARIRDQIVMELGDEAEVSLWSGGLDSLSGFLNRYLENPNKQCILVGFGFQKCAFGKQRNLHKKIKKLFPNAKIERYQVFHDIAGTPKKYPNPSFRMRGLLFLVEGLYASNLFCSDTLYLHENGIGAFNILFSGSGYWDRSLTANPAILSIVSKFYSKLIGSEKKIVNPFLFFTKGEMCKVFTSDILISSNILELSSSCDSNHRQKDKPGQCGYCSSCLLRRQGILGTGLTDPTRYSYPNLNDAKRMKYFTQFNNQADLWKGFLLDGVDQIYQQDPIIYESKKYMMKELNISGEEFDQKFFKLVENQICEWDRFAKFINNSQTQIS